MSRSKSRQRKRAARLAQSQEQQRIDSLSWADRRKIESAAVNKRTMRESTPRPKPLWVATVESSGSQTIGGDRRSASVTGLSPQQRRESKRVYAMRKGKRPGVYMTERGNKRTVHVATGRIVKSEPVQRVRKSEPNTRVHAANTKPRQVRVDGRRSLMDIRPIATERVDSLTEYRVLFPPVGLTLNSRRVRRAAA